MSELIFEKKVLDYGFVKIRNISGPTRRSMDYDVNGIGSERMFDADDTDPANSARMSFDQTDSGRTREQDLKLAEYLMKNLHTTPIEMIEVWVEMKLPIFVARQFVRHRTNTINEVSGRYVTLPAEWYIPEVVGAKPVGGAKQGQSEGLDPGIQDWFKKALQSHCATSYDDYLCAIRDGVAHEHARMLLHLNHYTHWLWKQDLHNMMHFLALRIDGHAQIEAREYGASLRELLGQFLPHSMELFDRYRRIR